MVFHFYKCASIPDLFLIGDYALCGLQLTLLTLLLINSEDDIKHKKVDKLESAFKETIKSMKDSVVIDNNEKTINNSTGNTIHKVPTIAELIKECFKSYTNAMADI